MLQRFCFENFKAFKTGKIEIKPITILLGANNSGKTSLLQLLLLIQQTANAPNKKYRAPLKINGKYVSLGDVENLFPNKNTSLQLQMGYEFESPRFSHVLKDQLSFDFLQFLLEFYQYLYKSYEVIYQKRGKKEGKVRPREYRIKELYDSFDLSNDTVDKLVPIIDELVDSLENTTEDELDSFFYGSLAFRNNISRFTEYSDRFVDRARSFNAIESYSHQDLTSSIALIRGFNQIKSQKFELNYIIECEEDQKLVIRQIAIRTESKDVIRVCFDSQEGKVKEVSSDYAPKGKINIQNSILSNYIIRDRTLFQLFSNTKGSDNKYLTRIIRDLFIVASSELERSLDDEMLRHISPVRAFPKRFYFLDEANIGLLTGDNIIEILKEDNSITKRVNNWLDRFNVMVSVSEFREIIHQLIFKRADNDLTLGITDVGFGISQVLPILVECFSAKRESVNLIEQPEIHLHPKMQAELADLFIEIINLQPDSSPLFVIETHSEYLLKRLRRRIAEGKISSDKIALYFVHGPQGEDSAYIEEITVSEKGAFKWPKDFYASDLEDITEWYRNQ